MLTDAEILRKVYKAVVDKSATGDDFHDTVDAVQVRPVVSWPIDNHSDV